MSSNLQLAAIMFTDIVGYTALMGKDEQKENRSLNNMIDVDKRIGRWCEGQFYISNKSEFVL